MHFSFDQLWDVAKWVTLIVVYPSAKFIWSHLTGKRKRRLDALDELLDRVTDLSLQNARLLEDMNALRKSNMELRAEVAELHQEVENLRRPTRKST